MNLYYSVISLSILFASSAVAYVNKQPLAETAYGLVKGSTHLSVHGRKFDAYRGIPYAKPPIGDLRFKAPEPPEKWSFSIDATKEGPFCIQKNYFFANPKVEGQEDCLYMNIYVPQTSQKFGLLPVMVFIHWGGFFAGRGTSDFLGPEYLMDTNVILVTFNYRLGVLGFLTTLDDEAPGNFGLKDQVAALKFVRENIENFGGDKDRVTIFGQSAGGGSVSLHLVSPASRGLFQQAISQSGASLDLWAKPLNALQKDVTAAQAAFVGCAETIGNSKKLIVCLRNVSANALVESGDLFKTFSVEPLTPFTLVTENKTEANPNPFLTKEPLEYLQQGEFEKVPYIIGSTQQEGILRASALLRQSNVLTALNNNFSTIISQLMYLQLSGGEEFGNLYENIKNFYLGGEDRVDINNPASVKGFIDLYTDRAFVYGIYQTVFLQLVNKHQPIWLYNFDYRGQFSYGDLFAATNETINFDWGTSHCDDLLYLFRSPGLFPDLTGKNDIYMSDALVSLWTNFAIYGSPDPFREVNWNPLTIQDVRKESFEYLNITGSLVSDHVGFKIERGYLNERLNFWIGQNLTENFPGLQ